MSNESRSKQFLKLISKEDGSRESMIQRVARQIREAGYKKDLYVVTTDSQADAIRKSRRIKGSDRIGNCNLIQILAP